MRRLPRGYGIGLASMGEIDALIAIDLAAGQMFAPTGLLSFDALGDHVPAGILADAIRASHVLVVRQGGAPAGFAMVSVREGSLYLDQISVDPAHGRKGLGRALIAGVIRMARQKKARRVTLSTFREVAWNGPYYKRLGFRELPEKRLMPWMKELESLQARSMDVSKRCFMEKRTGWI
jgi:GNAT superfamily N-acetyltransferase